MGQQSRGTRDDTDKNGRRGAGGGRSQKGLDIGLGPLTRLPAPWGRGAPRTSCCSRRPAWALGTGMTPRPLRG